MSDARIYRVSGKTYDIRADLTICGAAFDADTKTWAVDRAGYEMLMRRMAPLENGNAKARARFAAWDACDVMLAGQP